MQIKLLKSHNHDGITSQPDDVITASDNIGKTLIRRGIGQDVTPAPVAPVAPVAKPAAPAPVAKAS